MRIASADGEALGIGAGAQVALAHEAQMYPQTADVVKTAVAVNDWQCPISTVTRRVALRLWPESPRTCAQRLFLAGLTSHPQSRGGSPRLGREVHLWLPQGAHEAQTQRA